jgi:high-affinity Fe2+/Pb2+ permease
MEFYLAILAIVIMILVYTGIKWFESNREVKEARRRLEEYRIQQINMYGSDFNEWYREINE